MVPFPRWDTHGPRDPPRSACSDTETCGHGGKVGGEQSPETVSVAALGPRPGQPEPSQSLPAPLCDPGQPWLGEAVLMGTVATGHQRADTAVLGEEGLSGAGPALPWT